MEETLSPEKATVSRCGTPKNGPLSHSTTLPNTVGEPFREKMSTGGEVFRDPLSSDGAGDAKGEALRDPERQRVWRWKNVGTRGASATEHGEPFRGHRIGGLSCSA